ncbi:MAG: YggT family protein [Waddliaceae bacterium]|nr:YggT family protein [Waddliaceae bacterium]MBT7461189.1 YggT family protein [Waddliaceae bacterium]
MFFLVYVLHICFLVYTLMLFARILGSWIPELKKHKLMQFITYYTEPYLSVFRRIIPPLGRIDISPIVAFFALRFFESIIMRIII